MTGAVHPIQFIGTVSKKAETYGIVFSAAIGAGYVVNDTYITGNGLPGVRKKKAGGALTKVFAAEDPWHYIISLGESQRLFYTIDIRPAVGAMPSFSEQPPQLDFHIAPVAGPAAVSK